MDKTLTLILEFSPSTNPAATPSWENITTYMLGFHTTMGRVYRLSRIDHGKMTVRLKQKNREFDPTHAGPYNTAGKLLLPMRRMRLRATHNAVTYDLFSGFVESWPQSWQGSSAGFSDVSVIDAFLPLSRVDIGEGVTWPREFTGARINRVLDAVGWPAADRAIDTGYTEVPEETIPLGSGTTALDYLKGIADTELGALFCDGRGFAVFHDRHHRKTSTYLTSAGTFEDYTSTGITYTQDIELNTDADQIWNDVQCTSGGHTHQAEDATSQAKYLRRSMARTINAAREAECEDQAEYLLVAYKEPNYQLQKIRVVPKSTAGWAQVLGRAFGDHVTVKRWPQRVGSVITQECSVEAIERRWRPGYFDTSFRLSTGQAFSAVDWWILGDSTYGVLGSTTKLVY